MYLPLQNGAHVVHEATNPRGNTYVLAQTDRDFVVWAVDTDRHCFWGDYSSLTLEGLRHAIVNFQDRVGA